VLVHLIAAAEGVSLVCFRNSVIGTEAGNERQWNKSSSVASGNSRLSRVRLTGNKHTIDLALKFLGPSGEVRVKFGSFFRVRQAVMQHVEQQDFLSLSQKG